jgi:hypothetical protein
VIFRNYNKAYFAVAYLFYLVDKNIKQVCFYRRLLHFMKNNLYDRIRKKLD